MSGFQRRAEKRGGGIRACIDMGMGAEEGKEGDSASEIGCWGS